MARKYHVKVQPTPPRFPVVSKFSSFEAGRCLGCVSCVKKTSCVYGVFRKRGVDGLQVMDTGDSVCVGCLRCVQECKNAIFSRSRNPRYSSMGDGHWKPDIIAQTWKQAETGSIPVSGAGYRGPFSGPGFDQMWTDMSEIVRPTRDGIHGREYISTVVALGRKPMRLTFDAAGSLLSAPIRLFQLSTPVVLDTPPFGFSGEGTRRAVALAADTLETLAVATLEEARGVLSPWRARLLVRLEPGQRDLGGLEGVPVVEFPFAPEASERLALVRDACPEAIVSVRLALDGDAPARAAELVRLGADVIRLQADHRGNGYGDRSQAFIAGLVREVHLRLVEERLREQVTLIAGGGIALAEHMAKVILCGADAAAADLALSIAMECRVCPDCAEQAACPVELDRVDADWGARRIVNLIGAWHSQLIEVMGAMGLREVRRLRGELGRAMFFEDLERDCFAPEFGKRRQAAPAAGRSAQALPAPASPPKPAPHLPPAPESRGFAPAAELVHLCPSRFRNPISKYRVVVRHNCTQCGKCAEACRYGALVMEGGKLLSPRAHLCRGPGVCEAQGRFCMGVCTEDAVRVGVSPLWETLGDPRWTADLLASTWLQAETGRPPRDSGLEYRVGDSGGGLDRIDFVFPAKPPQPSLSPDDIDLTIPLNRREDGRPQVEIGFPVYGGGMSFGSVSLPTIVARARAYQAMGSFTCTGEGGYPEALNRYDDHVITQVATGLFGVREETIRRVRIVEFKYAQGAKPGLGGHLLGDKVTPAVARLREAVEGNALFSPFPFHSVYSVEDHKKHVDWIRHVNPRALVSVKVSTPSDVEMVAVGSFYAGAHIIHLDGSYGGTGAAPDIAKKNIAMPIEYAIPKVHRFLEQEGLRDKVTLIASGGLRTAWDVAKAIALGADGVVIGTSEMVALECVRCGRCESGRGCPRGIATTDPQLSGLYDDQWGMQRLVNLFQSWCVQLKEILWRLGLKSVRELVGRTDLLVHMDYEREAAAAPEKKTVEPRGRKREKQKAQQG